MTEDAPMPHKTMVVPLDGSVYSERAIPVAAGLADRLDCALLLVRAAEHGALEARAYLDDKAGELRAHGCKVDVATVADATAADAIATSAASVDDPVVCMTTHGAGRLRWATLGSVAEEVLRRVPQPTVLVGRHCSDDFLVRSTRLLACVDGPDSAEALAPTVREWTVALGLTVDVAVVVHPLDVESIESEQAILKELRRPFGDVHEATMLCHRYAAAALADHADRMPAALMAMNCRNRHGAGRFLLGSVTMGALHYTSCPVLVTHTADDSDEA